MPAAAARPLSSSATSRTTGLMGPPPSWRDARAPRAASRAPRSTVKPSRPSWRQTSRPMPRLAPVTRATGEGSVDVEDRLARDAAVDERVDGVGRLAPARLEVDVRVEAVGGHERDQAVEHPRRAA